MSTVRGLASRTARSGNGAGGGSAARRAFGVYTAIVTNVEDPQDVGRVKVMFPWLEDSLESHWARIAAPMAGNDRGFFFLPEVDDEVLVAFDHGDFDTPIVIGMLWNGQDKPPATNSDCVGSGGIEKRVLKTRKGHVLEFGDKEGEAYIKLETSDQQVKILMDEKDSACRIEVSGGPIEIHTDGDMSLKAGNIKIEADQKIELKAGTEVAVKAGTDAKLEAGMNLKAKAGMNAELKGSMNAKVEGSMNAEVKGGVMAKLEGGAMSTVKGGVVMIN